MTEFLYAYEHDCVLSYLGSPSSYMSFLFQLPNTNLVGIGASYALGSFEIGDGKIYYNDSEDFTKITKFGVSAFKIITYLEPETKLVRVDFFKLKSKDLVNATAPTDLSDSVANTGLENNTRDVATTTPNTKEEEYLEAWQDLVDIDGPLKPDFTIEQLLQTYCGALAMSNDAPTFVFKGKIPDNIKTEVETSIGVLIFKETSSTYL
ncbi:unnamed protein product [[Candida] boidinii]|uniref:Unnamed protein product n=1 Tax=Candida boidinii TaxID=5477 RepID=A0A9W6WIB8_CANBO|nr:hypothetical protein B5S30_g3348 [[Candida] boidinii]GME74912.1 unnamed protein product [[Candida] boidinii]GMF62548.1 unnamed protein product [[Candida] boidinii]GMF98162.1 unnamed protein product [[Candida] boidinii]